MKKVLNSMLMILLAMASHQSSYAASAANASKEDKKSDVTKRDGGGYRVVVHTGDGASVFPTAESHAKKHCDQLKKKYQYENLDVETKAPDAVEQQAIGLAGQGVAAGAASGEVTAAAQKALTDFTGTLDFQCT